MYNKLFTKILDSTVWLEDDATRLVWITFLAVMDEDGFVALSAVGNVAARARVSLAAAKRALAILKAPDGVNSIQDHEGRRIERVPYGWMVLNAVKYRDLIKRETEKTQTRERVARFRARSNANVTPGNEKVTPSVAVADTEAKIKSSVAPLALPDWLNTETWNAYVKIRPSRARTPDSLKAALRKLEKFRARGYDANDIVANSLENGWQGLFLPDAKHGQAATKPTILCGNCARPLIGAWSDSPKGRVCDPCWQGYLGKGWP